MVEERDDWFVINVRDARWFDSETFGKGCTFEKEGSRFPQTGVHLFVVEPGRANCRYHRENAQEDFLVLAGRCILLVNDEERPLRAGDYVHCGPGVTHVIVGDGDGPCTFLAIGHRPEKQDLWYPPNEKAAEYDASVDSGTADPREAYAETGERTPCEPYWPFD